MLLNELRTLCELDDKPTTGSKIAHSVAKAAINLTPLGLVNYASKGKLAQKAGQALHKVSKEVADNTGATKSIEKIKDVAKKINTSPDKLKRKYSITYTIKIRKSDGSLDIQTKPVAYEEAFTQNGAIEQFKKKHANEDFHIVNIERKL